jgi:exodeoxyribonuclease V alpha subunit
MDDLMIPQPESLTQEVLAGLIERVTYHNAENSFCVLRAKARGHRDVVTVVGYAAAISAGDWITASGEWVNDRTLPAHLAANFGRWHREISFLRDDPGHWTGLRQKAGALVR